MSIVLAKVAPSQYPRQRKKQCGIFTIKAVLDAYHLDAHTRPKDYLTFFSRVFFGYTNPLRLQSVLRRRGLEAPFRLTWFMNKQQRLALIKKHLRKGEPLILLVSSEENRYLKKVRFKKWVAPHWISVWGYDEEKKEFFIYNSLIVPEFHHKVPIGNISISYDRLLRLWKCTSFYRPLGNLYMPVSLKKK